ncbi:putative uridine kinase [Neobacillus bataviensis LMG 21833]|uniref:Putative uridine kinase n=1 Tax=Neobacillus bataviensis LMG 21833 TaxID=1117379 RepID=K6CF73_9BACI|nr:putative uridine kinase [Neobacillus bataviensis LMG 21833]
MDFPIQRGNFHSIEQFIKSFDQIPRKQKTLLIGIDGCGGSGKSTLANFLKEHCSDVTVVHMDDFYFPSDQIIETTPTQKPIGADVDWKRVVKQVLEPIRRNKEGHYQRYDWKSDQLAEWHPVPIGGIVIIEGVYSTRNELSNLYDYTIWIDCPRETRLVRGLERDGEEARGMWEDNWMISEDLYVKEHQPHHRAHLVVG